MNILKKIPTDLEEWIDLGPENLVDDEDMFDEDDEPVSIPDGWSKTAVEHYGGEGQGDVYYTVWGFTKGDDIVYVQFDGFYSSYDGVEYERYEIVQPEQQTITVYTRCV